MSDIPTYSEFGIDVLDVFYQDYVAAIFFFEDEYHEAVYERVLLRLMPRLRPFQVICLGGKTKLIAKAKEQRPAGAKWIFVLDKDFDDLVGSIFVHSDVYYLHAFSFENYLVDLRALINLAVDMNPRRLTVKLATQRCDAFSVYWTRLCASLERVCRVFAVARRYRVDIRTTKISIDDLLEGADPENPCPTDEWYQSYIERFRGVLQGDAEWLSDVEFLEAELKRAFDKNPRVTFPEVSIVDHLPGKHLLGCVIRAVERWLDVRLSNLDVVELYARLVGHTDLRRLAYLAERISGDHPELIAS